MDRKCRAGRRPLQRERQNQWSPGRRGRTETQDTRATGELPDLTTSIEDMFSAGDKIVTRLVWRGTHTGSYGGVEATGKPTQVRDFAVWRFEDDKVAENSTIQDQFLLLKRIGYLPEDVYAALPVLAGR